MVTISEDSYIRLTSSSLRHTPLVHLLSGLDEDGLELPYLKNEVCGISGYTEWVSSTIPIITIGWDWRLDVSQGKFRYVRVGLPRSNLMLVDSWQRDLGPIHTARLIEAAVDAIDWQDETAEAISARYAHTT